MRTDDLDFDLPPELIAQAPAADRPASRLLHYNRTTDMIAHRRFSDLPALLRPGDLLVFNDARVVPARFYLQKPTGGIIEGLFLSQHTPRQWEVLLKNTGPWQPDRVCRFASGHGAAGHGAADVEVRLIAQHEEGRFTIGVESDESPYAILERIGRMPLPPYIRRDKFADQRDEADKHRYQTVYAQTPGSVAAPTAGLHFNERIFDELTSRGVERAFLTLHVGLGTFKPVSADSLQDHTMHVEPYSLPPACCEAINRAKARRRRVISVGTTVARVLESQPEGVLRPVSDATGIFIYPPYRWRHVDALITNFHLPRSTLVALVAAFVGLETQRRVYREAIDHYYRFFSYGDVCMFE